MLVVIRLVRAHGVRPSHLDSPLVTTVLIVR